METILIDAQQLQTVLDVISNAANVVVGACAIVCFWLGMNSWESVAK
jgi:hypothetical protein